MEYWDLAWHMALALLLINIRINTQPKWIQSIVNLLLIS
jgi:hypothetical protein